MDDVMLDELEGQSLNEDSILKHGSAAQPKAVTSPTQDVFSIRLGENSPEKNSCSKKSRVKKYVPKVRRDDKPKRKINPATPKPRTPKVIRVKRNCIDKKRKWQVDVNNSKVVRESSDRHYPSASNNNGFIRVTNLAPSARRRLDFEVVEKKLDEHTRSSCDCPLRNPDTGKSVHMTTCSSLPSLCFTRQIETPEAFMEVERTQLCSEYPKIQIHTWKPSRREILRENLRSCIKEQDTNCDEAKVDKECSLAYNTTSMKRDDHMAQNVSVTFLRPKVFTFDFEENLTTPELLKKVTDILTFSGCNMVVNKLPSMLNHRTRSPIREENQTQSQDASIQEMGGKLVPYNPDWSKKIIFLANVHLDEETIRRWNLLEGIEQPSNDDPERDKKWENEREIFYGRAMAFISRMHRFQGYRRFSKWKGSVVDSVVGVFLTQNVSDILSSSSFMELASRFPLQTTDTQNDPGSSYSSGEELEVSISTQGQHCETNKLFSVLFNTPACGDERYSVSQVENPKEQTEIGTKAGSLGSTAGKLKTYDSHQDALCETEICSSNSFSAPAGHGVQEVASQDEIEREQITGEDSSEKPSSKSFKNIDELEDEESTVQVDIQKVETKNVGDSSRINDTMTNNVKIESQYNVNFNWDIQQKDTAPKSTTKGSNTDHMDSVDWDAVRKADVREIADAIKERGQNNILAERIQDFLNRLVKDHGSIDLEWLRDIEPEKAKEYLLSVRGLGIKSVECVRLLTLLHHGFPVDTNVARIAVRLGWVPLEPLPESLQLHVLELYPVMANVQKYLWPRLHYLDRETLYELHYQLITFGKVFCTKRKPNCIPCPLRADCKHYASANASAKPLLTGPLNTSGFNMGGQGSDIPLLEGSYQLQNPSKNCEPTIEEPPSPEYKCPEQTNVDIEDFFDYENDPDEIPTIMLNSNPNLVTKSELETETPPQSVNDEEVGGKLDIVEDGKCSKAVVLISRAAGSIPMPKMKNIGRLRTVHHVFELNDSHPLLQQMNMNKRELDDPSHYLFALWAPGESAQSAEPPESCDSQGPDSVCEKKNCFKCNGRKEADAGMVRGTILIPCRTAMKGRFPLNGTYFQINEVFADHESSWNPINVSREWLWNLPRRLAYFGTSVRSICAGMSSEEIEYIFQYGFVCMRGFDRKTRAPKPLAQRLHLVSSKEAKKKKMEKEK